MNIMFLCHIYSEVPIGFQVLLELLYRFWLLRLEENHIIIIIIIIIIIMRDVIFLQRFSYR